MGKPKLPSGQICSQVRKFLEMKEKRDHKGGRTPLTDEEKRKNLVATKLTDIELEVARAKAEAFKMTVYELLKEALNRCVISVKQYDEFIKIVDRFSLSHLMRLCIIRSVVYPQRYAGTCLQEQQTGADKRPKGRPGTGHQGHPADIQTGQGSGFTTTKNTRIKTTLIWHQET